MTVAYLFGPHTNFIEVQFLFWLVIGLIFAYININSENIDVNSESSTQKRMTGQNPAGTGILILVILNR